MCVRAKAPGLEDKEVSRAKNSCTGFHLHVEVASAIPLNHCTRPDCATKSAKGGALLAIPIPMLYQQGHERLHVVHVLAKGGDLLIAQLVLQDATEYSACDRDNRWH